MRTLIFCMLLLTPNPYIQSSKKRPTLDPILLSQIALVATGTAVSLVHLVKMKFPLIPSIEEFLAYKLWGIDYSTLPDSLEQSSLSATTVRLYNESKKARKNNKK